MILSRNRYRRVTVLLSFLTSVTQSPSLSLTVLYTFFQIARWKREKEKRPDLGQVPSYVLGHDRDPVVIPNTNGSIMGSVYFYQMEPIDDAPTYFWSSDYFWSILVQATFNFSKRITSN